MAERSDDHTELAAPRLELLKALGDNTRYAIYLELARAPAPLATAQIAETLGLHANTVRPHLDRMLLRLAAAAEVPSSEAIEAGREQGATAARRRTAGTCAEAITQELAALG